MSFAPHIWKSLLPLRFLNISFHTELLTLTQLREDLPTRLGLHKVTLPTLLIVHSDGTKKCIVDSYNIAIYLDATYGTPTKSIYAPSGNGAPEDVFSGRAHARFIEHWVDKCMAHELRPCVLHTTYSHFPDTGETADVKSRAHFLAKCGQAKLDELISMNSDDAWKGEQYARARKQLGVIDILLREREGPESFIGGAKPSHSDFCIFAFYPYSLTNPELVRNTWRHPELPFVSNWLDAMLDSGLVSRDELLPDLSDDAAIVADGAGKENNSCLIKPH